MKLVFKFVNGLTIITILALTYLYLNEKDQSNLYFSIYKTYEVNVDDSSFEVFFIAPIQTEMFLSSDSIYTFESTNVSNLEVIDSNFLQEIFLDNITYYLYKVCFRMPNLNEHFNEKVWITLNYHLIKIKFFIGKIVVSAKNCKEVDADYDTSTGEFVVKISLPVQKYYPYVNEEIMNYYFKDDFLIIRINKVMPGINYVKIYYDSSKSEFAFNNDIYSRNFFDYTSYLKDGVLLD